MHSHSKMFLALAAATLLPSTMGCILFNATLHEGATQADSAQNAINLENKETSGGQTGDTRLDVYFWDDRDNDETVEPKQDSFCTGVDVKPYAENSWTVPCTPEANQVELDLFYDPDITEGGVLIGALKYKSPKSRAKQGNDPDKDYVYTFNTPSQDGKGKVFENRIYCKDCTSSKGQPLKC